MSVIVNSGSESYYYDTSESAGEFCEIKELECGVVAACCSGFLSTAIISVVTSKTIWPEALYLVPLISLLSGIVFFGCGEQALKSEKSVSKVICTLASGVSAIPSLPFLIGALPVAGALFAVSACIEHKRTGSIQYKESYTEI